MNDILLLLGPIHTRHYCAFSYINMIKWYCDKKIFFGQGCQQAKVSSYQIIIQAFYKSLLFLLSRNLLQKNVKCCNVFYLFIAILCAKILCVNMALHYIFQSLDSSIKLSCDSRFQLAFTAFICVFKVITLVCSNQKMKRQCLSDENTIHIECYG